MTRPINSVARARMRRVSEALMEDTCAITTTTAAAQDSFGWIGRTDASPVESPCGVQWLSTADQITTPGGGDRQSVVVGGVLRLPLAMYGVVAATTRITITEMRGETLPTPIICEVVGEPRRGTTVVVCDLRRVTL